MRQVVLRGFFSRKLRALLTGLAIALGVCLMAGTYVLTDTIDRSFAHIFDTATKGIDVSVTPHKSIKSVDDSSLPPIPASALERVKQVPGVKLASGTIFSQGTILDAKNKRLGSGGAPTFIASVDPGQFESFKASDGRLPAGDGEVALDAGTAKDKHVAIGDTVAIVGRGPARRFRVVGLVKFGGAESFGASAALLTLRDAQQVSGERNSFDSIDVAADTGVTPEALRNRIRAVLPRSLDVRTGQQQADKQTQDLHDNLGFLRTFLLVFAYVALFVGGFIIFNTFSITVAQRTREFGLLRMLGASRRQVLRSVVAESLLLGVFGSVVGLALGLAVAPGLKALFKAFGASLPADGIVLETRTIVVSLLVGTIVTLLSGLAPAVRATRVPPIAALREGVDLPKGRLAKWAPAFAILVLVLGGLAVAGGLVGGAGIAVLGLGTLLIFMGVALLSPRLVPPLAAVVGVTVEWRGLPGRLARQNAVRQPGRTATTAAALMIGLALVTFVSFFAAGLTKSIDAAVDKQFAGDLIVESTNANSQQGIPAAIAPALSRVDGVATATPVAFSTARYKGDDTQVTGFDPRSFQDIYSVDWKVGSPRTLATLGPDGAVLTKKFADDKHLKVGSRMALTTPSGKHPTLTVRGIVKDEGGLFASISIPRETMRTQFGQRDDAFDFLAYRPGADKAAVRARVDTLLDRAFPSTETKDKGEFKDQQASQINQFATFMYVLLSLAVIVSLFGLVNTLALSIFERRRELGMLRAVGTARSQVRRMIRYEAVVTALIGAVLGLVLGALFAIVITSQLDGFQLAIPVGRIIGIAVLAGIAGIIAAALPARRAARTNVLEALAYE